MLRTIAILLALGYVTAARGQNTTDDQQKLAESLRNDFKTVGTRIDKAGGQIFSSNAAFEATTWYTASMPIPFDDGEILMAYADISFPGTPPIVNRIFRFLFIETKSSRIVSQTGAEYGAQNTVPLAKPIHDRFLKVSSQGSLDHYSVHELNPDGTNKDSWVYLYELSATDLRLYRNYIFAAYGYEFKSEDLRNYFAKFSWYKPLYKNVDHLLTVEDKALIAALQQNESAFHAYKALPAPGLAEQFTEVGKIMPASQAGFFFPSEKISQENEYTTSIPAIRTAGGYLLGLTRSVKPNASGIVLERSHNFVFWKAGKTGQPVTIPMYPMKEGAIVYPKVKVIQELFVEVTLPEGYDTRNTANGYDYFVISGNDMFRLRNTPKAELQYFRNYLLARYGSSDPEVKAMFGKYDWYKPVNKVVDMDQFKSEDQIIWYGLDDN